VAAEGPTIDALSQFMLTPALGALGHSVNFTQANVFMLAAAALTLGMLYFGARSVAIVPGRL